ncbi:unnamed protein product [Nippostrongylus brasiliensis]|uniref:Fork-head domain-containing protein n=1 Tax=Nippostrongylus brasiliensis TaxID=27835 RepID=A0A158R229_NIPBR|nr:unnamed protein product [Nippostrongylus brasiliensis]
MLAIQERLQNQFRTNNTQQPANNFFNHHLNMNQSALAGHDVNRLFQQLLLGLPPLLPGLPGPLDLGCLPGTSMTHPLWQHNLCAWPECNHPCENLAVFLNHLSQAHTFNERSTSEMRAQVELVDSLEHRLSKERNRLQAMMQHLHMKQSPDTTTPALGKVEPSSPPLRSPKQEPAFTASSSLSTTQTQPVQSLPSVSLSISEAATTPLTIPAPSVVSSEGSPTSGDQQLQKTFVPRRSRISDKSVLPISADIARNREFYRSNDVRPPYTYASLIRQAIMESPECQLTLNEIYTWFTDTFAYFRRNAATWKMLAQRIIDQTALSMIEQRNDDTVRLAENALLNGGLEGVLSFLEMIAANSGDTNPLSLLSAAAAASEHSSCAVTPNLMVKEEPREALMEIQDSQLAQINGRIDSHDPDATPPADDESRLVVEDQQLPDQQPDQQLPSQPAPVASSC